MLAARAALQEAGHFSVLATALAELVKDRVGDKLVVEAGAGTGYYLAAALGEGAGLALDASKHAARRAARAHPRIGSIVADTGARLPLADGCAAVVLDVFAPRNAGEFRRVLGDGGVLVVVTPSPEHLAELRAVFDMISVDPDKAQRLAGSLGKFFERRFERSLAWEMQLSPADVRNAILMGPSAHHIDRTEMERTLESSRVPKVARAVVQIEVYG